MLELLIVTAIVVTVASAGIGFYINYGKSVDLNSVVQILASDLKQAQSRSMIGEGGFKWGVHLVNGTKDYYEIFSTPDVYSNGAKVILSTTYLSSGVTFSSPSSGTSSDIIFNKISGGTTPSFVGLTSGSITERIGLSSIGSIEVAEVAVKTLIVAGGGGGGGSNGGGGGAGGYLSGTTPVITQSYTVTVGTGGNAGIWSSSPNGTAGGNSSFNSSIAIGGGGGRGEMQTLPSAGGSGGGGAGYDASKHGGASGIYGQGNSGGTGYGGSGTNLYLGGGGGGAGAVGADSVISTLKAGNGGDGFQSSISGSATYYAGGGGGGGYPTTGTAGSGGNGGGAAGSMTTVGGTGTANTGGGGGGGKNGSNGGAGASGIVIISYSTASGITATGGTITTVGSNTVHTFTSSGTFIVTVP